MKTAEETRKRIDEAYTVFNATKTSVQELCSEEVKTSIDDNVNVILERTIVNDQTDKVLMLIDQFHNDLREFLKMLAELESWPCVGQKQLKELLHPTKPVTDQEKVFIS